MPAHAGRICRYHGGMFETNTYDDPLVLDPGIRARWTFLETSSAAAVLRSVCSDEWRDITHVLATFALDPAHWLKPGGSEGDVAKSLNAMFRERGWREIRVDLKTQGLLFAKGPNGRRGPQIGETTESYQEGYLADNLKGRVVLDVEWNAKDGNLDRDLSAYRAWHEAGVISAAVLITQDRSTLKPLAKRLWDEYQAGLPPEQRNPRLPIDMTTTTTNFEKAVMRVRRSVMGTCPLLVVAVTEATWNGNPYTPA